MAHLPQSKTRIEKLQRELFSTLTHEIKTPITTLKLLVHTECNKLRKQHCSPSTIRELQFIDRELDRLTSMITDYSDFSHILNNKLNIDIRICSIAPVIREVVHQMKTLEDSHTIVLSPPHDIPVVADKDRVRQVLVNLLKNAIIYSYPDTKIRVSTSISNNYYTVAVTNKGTPIPAEKQKTIFDRFFQLHENRSGMGLGLYISKKIVDLHKGKIRVKSTPDGSTTFSFSLIRDITE